jgi:hypothetical protein
MVKIGIYEFVKKSKQELFNRKVGKNDERI